MKTTEIAWAAGFFEGEGTIQISGRRQKSIGILSVELSQVDLVPITFLVQRWGGSVYRYPKTRTGRSYNRWVFIARNAATFLRDIEPHVVRDEVRVKIVLALTFQDQKLSTWGNRTKIYRLTQLDFVARMKTLNRRGAEVERVALSARVSG